MSDNKRYKISILGDSISTYDGYNPRGNAVYYRLDKAAGNGIKSVEDTWWKQVLDGVGGELCVNESYSGSLVAGSSDTAACSDRRCSRLAKDDESPNVILIYMGTNDRGCEIAVGMDDVQDTGAFYGAYRSMLKKLKLNYPRAKIVCGTLLIGNKDNVSDYDRFAQENEGYNEAIRLAAKEENCLLADIAQFGERYETLDYCHPTKDGHKLMAKLWLDCIKPLLN